MTDVAVQLPEANRRLDAIDRKILTVLQEDASLSVAEHRAETLRPCCSKW